MGGKSSRLAFARRLGVAVVTSFFATVAHALPNISLAPLNPDFGTGQAGVQRDITITLTNVSLANVQIGSLNFGGAGAGVPATWGNGPVGPQACNAGIILVPTASCTYQHSVIQDGPGISTYVTNLTVVVIGGGDETFTLNSIARAAVGPAAAVPVFAPGALALAAGLLAALGAFVLRRRRPA